jgi:hypothetical protein
VSAFVSAQDQECAGANQKHGPYGAEVNSSQAQRFELKRNSQQGHEAAPKAPDHRGGTKQLLNSEVDEDQRPEEKNLVCFGETELVQQENETHEQDDDPEDEMPI